MSVGSRRPACFERVIGRLSVSSKHLCGLQGEGVETPAYHGYLGYQIIRHRDDLVAHLIGLERIKQFMRTGPHQRDWVLPSIGDAAGIYRNNRMASRMRRLCDGADLIDVTFTITPSPLSRPIRSALDCPSVLVIEIFALTLWPQSAIRGAAYIVSIPSRPAPSAKTVIVRALSRLTSARFPCPVSFIETQIHQTGWQFVTLFSESHAHGIWGSSRG
jgi:hypothetical protein